MIGIDTNILVYAVDNSEQNKHTQCKAILKEVLTGKQRACIPAQVLAEFVYVVTKKVQNPIQLQEAQKIVRALVASAHTATPSYVAQDIANIQEANNMWDALLETVLLHARVRTLYTENTKDFKNIHTINPVHH